MGYEIFTEKKSRQTDPTVSVLKSGNLFFNSACYEQFLKKHKFLCLLYDHSNNFIGIKPTDQSELYTYKITLAKNRSGCAISALSFMNKYKINHSKTRTFKAVWNENEKLIEVDLKSGPAA